MLVLAADTSLPILSVALVDGAELYTTASPCWNCFKLIANAGIRKIFYGEFYRDERSRETAARIGIELVDLQMPTKVGA